MYIVACIIVLCYYCAYLGFLQSDSGLCSEIPPPVAVVSNVGEDELAVFVGPPKQQGKFHGNPPVLFIENSTSSQGLISGCLSVGSECFSQYMYNFFM